MFAERFGLDPDEVIKKSFNTVINFRIMWKEQQEFQERYDRIKSSMNSSKCDRDWETYRSSLGL